MTKSPRLNDLQLILLSTAASRDNGSLLPVAENIANDAERIGAAIKALMKRQLVEEQPVTDRSLTFREQDQEPIGLFITDAGRTAIGAGDEADGNESEKASSEAPKPAAGKTERGPSKIDQVITLLRRQEGATLAEMVEATGWLPHTTRAALTGLKKKGHTIEKSKSDDVTCYRIAEAG
jgi:hypothetical protein